MQATHQIDISREELRDIIQAIQLMLDRDYELYGRVATVGAADETESLPKIKQLIDNHRELHMKLSDWEFEWWRIELDEAHLKADAEDMEKL